MVRRWDRWKNPWDREYAKRGRLWRGAADLGPLGELVPPPGPVLEVGCGDGKFLAALHGAGYRWIGVDFSGNALRLAPAVGGERATADARALPFRSGAATCVVARYLLGALGEPDRRRAADELVRVLKPGGVLLVEEFTPADFRHGTGTEVERGTFERNQGILTHYFEPDELRGLLHPLRPVREEALRHTQRVGSARRPRAAHRIVARRPS